MGYLIPIDEVSDDQLLAELARRGTTHRTGRCAYCGYKADHSDFPKESRSTGLPQDTCLLPNLGTNPLTVALGYLIHEYNSAKAKHGEMTMDGDMNGIGVVGSDLLKLAALMEEVGEVAETITYDKAEAADVLSHRRKELVQVANVALTWSTVLPA